MGIIREALRGIDWHTPKWQLVVALCLAVLLTTLLEFIKPYLSSASEEDALDQVMLFRNESGGESKIPPMVYLNIDEVTREALQQTSNSNALSRDVILNMLASVLIHSPELVIVDYAMTYDSAEPDQDLRLLTFLRSAGGLNGETLLQKINPNRTPIILAWGPGYSPFSEIVEQSSLLHWGGVRTLEDEGGMTRRFSHWDFDCTGEKPVIVPGVHWLAATILTGHPEQTASLKKDLSDFISENGDNCELLTDISDRDLINVQLGSEMSALSTGGIDTRIHYEISWNFDNASSVVHSKRPDGVVVEGPQFENIVAYGVVVAHVSLPADMIHRKLVLLGSSYQDTKDHFQTPVGQMPGSVVIANAIKSVAEYGILSRPPFWQKLLTVIVLTFITFIYFNGCSLLSFYDPIIFKQLYFIISFIVWSALGYLLLSIGTWVDILIPHYIIAVYFAREDYIELKIRIQSLTQKVVETKKT